MAEFLVKAVDSTNRDPIKDQRGCYKRGDVVVVMPDGHKWGKEEGLPKFAIIKIPGLSVKDAKEYTASEYPLGDLTKKPIRRRRYRVPLDDLSAAIKSELDTGSTTVDKAQITTYIKDKAK